MKAREAEMSDKELAARNTAALCVTDGALVVVIVNSIDSVHIQTEADLRRAILECAFLYLMVGKVDHGLLESELPAVELHQAGQLDGNRREDVRPHCVVLQDLYQQVGPDLYGQVRQESQSSVC